jgi:hypothetical protein
MTGNADPARPLWRALEEFNASYVLHFTLAASSATGSTPSR